MPRNRGSAPGRVRCSHPTIWPRLLAQQMSHSGSSRTTCWLFLVTICRSRRSFDAEWAKSRRSRSFRSRSSRDSLVGQIKELHAPTLSRRPGPSSRLSVAFGVTVRALFVVMLQVFVQGRRARFFQQILEHHVLAAALRETRAILLSQGGNLGIPVLTVNSPALVAMTMVETCFRLCHAGAPPVIVPSRRESPCLPTAGESRISSST
jgi:hypothetical protein